MIIRGHLARRDATAYGDDNCIRATVILRHLRTVNPLGESPAIEARKELLLVEIGRVERQIAEALADVRDLTTALIERRP